jgi:hypothetical protein
MQLKLLTTHTYWRHISLDCHSITQTQSLDQEIAENANYTELQITLDLYPEIKWNEDFIHRIVLSSLLFSMYDMITIFREFSVQKKPVIYLCFR